MTEPRPETVLDAAPAAGSSGLLTLDPAAPGPITDLQRGVSLDPAGVRGRVAARAGALRQAGVAPGAAILVAGGAPIDVLVTLLAAWRVGAIAGCVDPTLSPRELAAVVGALSPRLVLCADGGSLPNDLRAVAWSDLDDTAPPVYAPQSTLRDPALVLFTSGSSGRPKGVRLSHAALDARLRLNAQAIGEGPLRRSLCALPLHFGHGLIGNSLTPWLHGGHLHVADADAVTLGRELGAWIDRHRIAFMSSVPAQWRLAMRLGNAPAGGSLMRVHVGSSPLPAALWHDVIRFSGCTAVVNAYGMTEAANWVAGACAASHPPEDGLVGRPWGGRVAVRAEDGVRRGHGEGELLLRSPALMDGYLGDAQRSACVLEDGWLRTGDRGHVDERGTIRLRGRDDNVINRAGSKVYPEELEMVLQSHPEVSDCCAFGVPDALAGEAVAVTVCLRPGARADDDALAAWCRQRLRRDAVATRWQRVDALPRSARGKLDRARVRAAFLACGVPNSGASGHAGASAVRASAEPAA